MSKALNIVWRSIVDTYNELFAMVGLNLVWFVLYLITLIVFGFPVTLLANIIAPAVDLGFWPLAPLAILLVIGPNPASVGIHYYTNQLVVDERVEFGLVWRGLRKYWAKSLLLCLISVVGTFTVVANIGFYVTRGSQVLSIIGVVFAYILYFWISMLFYVQPLLVEQENKRVLLIFRNAAVLAAGSPLVTLIVLLSVGVFIAIGTVLPIVAALLLGSLVATIGSRATTTLLDQYRNRQKPGAEVK